MLRSYRFLILGSMLTACSGGGMLTDLAAPNGAALSERNDASVFGGGFGGAVYSQTNAATGNAVLVYHRAANGTLTAAGTLATGGNGSGSGLGSQGSVTLSDDGDWLFVVNAGSNDVSSFSVDGNGSLTLRGRASSGGTTPISVASHDNLLYVVNTDGAGNIAGLRVRHDGSLVAIPGSSRPLSAAGSGPAEVSFDPSGSWLVVTEKNTNMIDTWRVGDEGFARDRVVNVSAGMTPFGFTFTSRGVLAVTEAFGGAVDASAVSTYTINRNGTLSAITKSAPTTETAACWIAATNNGKFVYAANTGSASVTGYDVRDGRLSILNADGKTGNAGTTPIDVAMTQNSQVLYGLNAGAHTISIFGVSQSNGGLSANGSVTVPAGAVGLAAK
ncbi:MAG: beta-propeller fold lactonase family protein [Gemmatimonadaceae bacterium]